MSWNPLTAIRRGLSAMFAERSHYHRPSRVMPVRTGRRRLLTEFDSPANRWGATALGLPWESDELPEPYRHGRGVELWREMERNDPTIAAAIRLRRSVVAGLPRRLNGNGAPEPIANFVRDALAMIEDLSGDLSELLDAVPWGWAVSECILAPHSEAGGRPLLFPVRLQSRDPGDYVFDADGQLRLLTQGNPADGEPLPAAPKFLALAYNPRFENPYGTPELRSLYGPYVMKRTAAKYWASAVEKHGMPFLLARLRRSLPDEEVRRLEELLEGFQSESFGWFSGEDVEDIRFLEPGRAFGPEMFLPFLEYWDRRILVRYLGSHLAVEQTGPGSRAAAETHAAVSAAITIDDARWLSHRFSSGFIRPLVKLNFDYRGPTPELELLAASSGSVASA